MAPDKLTSQAPWIERGVLVYGARKSGTTLFQNLLDGGDEIFVYPAELKLKYFARGNGRSADIEDYYSASRIGTVDSPHFSLPQYRELWRKAHAENTLEGLPELIRFDAGAVYQSADGVPAKPATWCAKEVGGPTESILELWRAMFPAGRALFIVRDPRMITRAVLNDRRRKMRRLSFLAIVRETLDPLRIVAEQSKWLGYHYVLMIAYEDLVESTSTVMARVAQFLGVSDSPRFSSPTMFGEPVVVRTSSRDTTEVFGQAASWRDGLTLREQIIVAIAGAMAKLLPRYRVNYAALRRRARRLPN